MWIICSWLQILSLVSFLFLFAFLLPVLLHLSPSSCCPSLFLFPSSASLPFLCWDGAQLLITNYGSLSRRLTFKRESLPIYLILHLVVCAQDLFWTGMPSRYFLIKILTHIKTWNQGSESFRKVANSGCNALSLLVCR